MYKSKKPLKKSPASRSREAPINHILLNFATTLSTIKPNDIDREIHVMLSQAGHAWGFEHIVLMTFSETKANGFGRASHHRDIRFPLSICSPDNLPWIAGKVTGDNGPLMLRLPEDLPSHEWADRAFLVSKGFRTALVLPLLIAGTPLGALIFASYCEDIYMDTGGMGPFHLLPTLVAGLLERKHLLSCADEFRHFEQLLSEISVEYINLPFTKVKKRVRTDLGRLGDLFGFDRCMLYLFGKGGQFRLEKSLCWWPHQDDGGIKAVDKILAKDPNWMDRYQYLRDQWLAGNTVIFTHLDELPKEAEKTKKLYSIYGVKSGISVPISIRGRVVGALDVTTTQTRRTWTDDMMDRVLLFGVLFASVLERKRIDKRQHKTFFELKSLKEQTQADYNYLQEKIEVEHSAGLAGISDVIKNITTKVKMIGPTQVTALILGETGTGKGVVARAIHHESKRKHRPLVQVNCSALNPGLIESELFGHEKGAFTSADTKRIGRFELAHGATLFLDEIGELPMELQAKLLRVLENGEFERVGGSATIKTNVRLILATNRDLEKEVAEGRFRQDLWYRLSVFPITVPPLRDHPEDIPSLVNSFAKSYSKYMGKKLKGVSAKTIKALKGYSWLGNVRELRNLVERAVLMSVDGEKLHIEVPGDHDIAPEKQNLINWNPNKDLNQIEQDHIVAMLKYTQWRINGPHGAAKRLGIKPSTLRSRMKKLGIKRPV